MSINSFLKLTPAYREYVWGGERLRPGHYPTAEAWVVWEGDVIESGSLAGKTLGEAAVEYGESLLGTIPTSRTGTRFPLLIKLLDCAQWLSLQVHPDDQLALELEGEGQFGKTEAWHILDAQPDAKLIAGLKPNTSPELVAESIRNGTVIDHVEYVNVQQGDTVFMPAGTLHALGPGLLIYEVQQTSDWTYRVYDWGRPATEKRQLHIDKSIRATRADFAPLVMPPPATDDGSRNLLVESNYFTLEMLSAVTNPVEYCRRNLPCHHGHRRQGSTASRGRTRGAGEVPDCRCSRASWELFIPPADDLPRLEIQCLTDYTSTAFVRLLLSALP
jgi:mannose-6-phosphate isomerase